MRNSANLAQSDDLLIGNKNLKKYYQNEATIASFSRPICSEPEAYSDLYSNPSYFFNARTNHEISSRAPLHLNSTPVSSQFCSNLLLEAYDWVDSIPLSRPRRHLGRDFSDSVLMAELIRHFKPHWVDMHNYNAANSKSQKQYNWELLNKRVLTRRLGIRLTQNQIEDLADGNKDTVEDLLLKLKSSEALFDTGTTPIRYSSRLFKKNNNTRLPKEESVAYNRLSFPHNHVNRPPNYPNNYHPTSRQSSSFNSNVRQRPKPLRVAQRQSTSLGHDLLQLNYCPQPQSFPSLYPNMYRNKKISTSQFNHECELNDRHDIRKRQVRIDSPVTPCDTDPIQVETENYILKHSLLQESSYYSEESITDNDIEHHIFHNNKIDDINELDNHTETDNYNEWNAVSVPLNSYIPAESQKKKHINSTLNTNLDQQLFKDSSHIHTTELSLQLTKQNDALEELKIKFEKYIEDEFHRAKIMEKQLFLHQEKIRLLENTLQSKNN